MEKIIFAEEAATVHVLIGDVVENPDGTKTEPYESRVLLPGETLSLSEVPSYLQEMVKKGEAAGITLLTPAQAKRLLDKAKAIKSASISDLVDDDDEE